MRWLAIFLFLLAGGRAAESGYVEKMIACDEKDERWVSEAFSAFQTLLEKHELPKESLHFPSRLVVQTRDHIIVERAFYIAPNELRGFELSFPKDCFSEKDGMLSLSVPVVVAKDTSKSEIRILALKKKEPNKALEPTPTSVTPPAAQESRRP